MTPPGSVDGGREPMAGDAPPPAPDPRAELLDRVERVAGLGGWQRDLVTGELTWTDEVSVLFGLRPGSFGGSLDDFLALVHPGDRDRVRAELRRFESTGEPHQVDYRVRTADGRDRTFSDRGVVEVDDAGRPVRLVGTVRDVTDERAAQARDHAARRWETLGRLASGVAHDLNNLLTVILGHLDLLAPVTAGSDGELDRLAALQATRRAAHLAVRLLDYGRLDQHAEPVDLRLVATEAGALIRAVADDHVALELDLGDEPAVAHVDPVQLQQVVLNLLLNAVEAMPRGGTVRVEAGSAGGEVHLAVVDDGTGMAPDVLDHALQPYFTTKPRTEGTGLGLPTAEGIVVRAGGRLELESSPGRGTRATVTLPRWTEP